MLFHFNFSGVYIYCRLESKNTWDHETIGLDRDVHHHVVGPSLGKSLVSHGTVFFYLHLLGKKLGFGSPGHTLSSPLKFGRVLFM